MTYVRQVGRCLQKEKKSSKNKKIYDEALAFIINLINYLTGLYTVRRLFKKFTQHCETYEPADCCVKKIHNLCNILHKLYIFFFYTTIGNFICFTVLCKVLNSGLTVYH